MTDQTMLDVGYVAKRAALLWGDYLYYFPSAIDYVTINKQIGFFDSIAKTCKSYMDLQV